MGYFVDQSTCSELVVPSTISGGRLPRLVKCLETTVAVEKGRTQHQLIVESSGVTIVVIVGESHGRAFTDFLFYYKLGACKDIPWVKFVPWFG